MHTRLLQLEKSSRHGIGCFEVGQVVLVAKVITCKERRNEEYKKSNDYKTLRICCCTLNITVGYFGGRFLDWKQDGGVAPLLTIDYPCVGEGN